MKEMAEYRDPASMGSMFFYNDEGMQEKSYQRADEIMARDPQYGDSFQKQSRLSRFNNDFSKDAA